MTTIKLMAAAIGLMALAACQHHDSSGDLWRAVQMQQRGR